MSEALANPSIEPPEVTLCRLGSALMFCNARARQHGTRNKTCDSRENGAA
jgi:hypothetical protein